MIDIILEQNQNLGHVSNNNSYRLVKDVSDIIKEFGEGTFSVIFKRSRDTAGYPVPSAQITVSNKILYVVLSSAEMAYSGPALVQIMYTHDTTVLMSHTYITWVDDSLSNTGTVPSPWTNWVNQLYEAMKKEPKIQNNTWWTWDNVNNVYVDTGVVARAAGIPSGGTAGQVLSKKTDGDYDTEWVNAGAGSVSSVNGKTGVVVLTASDVNALPDSTVIPTKTSELTNDSGFLTSHQSLSAYRTSADQDIIDNGKQDTLTAGSNISISNNEISATDTTYSAGSGLTLTGTTFSNNISFTLSGNDLYITNT